MARFRINKVGALLFVLLGSITVKAYSWWEAGHMLVANIAYHHLNATAKNEVKRLMQLMDVESTPRNSYAYDKRHPQYTFMAISLWADNLYAYPNYLSVSKTWHYIQHAYSPDGTPFPEAPRDNVVWAIKQFRQHLSLKQANDYDKSRSLSYIVHFLGDIHQPLHTAEFFSKDLPHGDRGGNDYKIEYREPDGEKLTNLHALWDSGAALYPSKGYMYNVSDPKEIDALTKVIMQDFPTNYFSNKAKIMDPEVWEAESHAIAIEAHQTPIGAVPETSYLEKSSLVIEEQIALAGYRLAHLLNQALK